VINALGQAQSALLVGGTSEIGLAVCRRLLAARGRRLALAGRSLDDLDDVRRTLAAQSPQLEVTVVALDMTVTAEHDRALDEVFGTGDVDVVVVAAGVLDDQTMLEEQPDRAVLLGQTNYVGPASVLLRAASRMEQQGHGVIVVMSSVAGLRPRRSNYVYGSSKAGLDALARGLAARLAGSGVRVVTVRPGFVHTRMTSGLEPAPLAVEADDVALAVTRAVTAGDDVVWVPGAMRWVMGALRALPEAVFRRLDL
jgi:decaprenylphospho-beta-D-erythro-pentofuranosid-2-ulose 2-reductase